MPFDHEEADTRILVYVIDLLKAGCSTCLVHTIDTDVVVILIGKVNHLLTLNLFRWPLVRQETLLNFVQFHLLCFG